MGKTQTQLLWERNKAKKKDLSSSKQKRLAFWALVARDRACQPVSEVHQETQSMTQSQSPCPVTEPGLREISGDQPSPGNGTLAVSPIWMTAEGRIFHNSAVP